MLILFLSSILSFDVGDNFSAWFIILGGSQFITIFLRLWFLCVVTLSYKLLGFGLLGASIWSIFVFWGANYLTLNLGVSDFTFLSI